MAWVVGSRKGKKLRIAEGPIHYTKSVLDILMQLSSDPAERALFSRLIRLLDAGEFGKFRKESPIGLVNMEEQAVRAVVSWIASSAHWMDVETKAGGKAAYSKKVRGTLSEISRKIGYRGDWEALASSLTRRAARFYGWEES